MNSTPSRSLIQLGHILESSPKQPTPDRLSQPNRTVFQALISPSNLDGCFNMVDTLSFTSGYVKSSMTFIRVEQNQLAPSPAVVRLSSGMCDVHSAADALLSTRISTLSDPKITGILVPPVLKNPFFLVNSAIDMEYGWNHTDTRHPLSRLPVQLLEHLLLIIEFRT